MVSLGGGPRVKEVIPSGSLWYHQSNFKQEFWKR